jgi:ketosteroid isomerase-like protein
MKTTILLGAIVIATGSLVTSFASAQIQWTPEQKAIWATENEIFNDFANNNMQGAYSHYDESYFDWNINDPVPFDKGNIVKFSDYSAAQGDKMDIWAAQPLVVWVKGDLAYADYYYYFVSEDKNGKKTDHRERWMDVLMKENGKWMIVGDHGGAVPGPSK